MPANPYSGALADIPQLRVGSKKGLDLIYKAMRTNLNQFGGRLNTLDTQIASSIAGYGKNLQGSLAGYGKTGLADVLDTAALEHTVDPAEQKYLTSLAMDDVSEYQGYGGSLFKGEAGYQKSLRGIDKQYVKDLLGSAAREKQARVAELNQNLLDYASGLRTQGAQFDAQQQMLNWQNGQLGGPLGTGGQVESIARRYLGIPYKWGGTGRGGFDCSGLTQRIFADMGISIPRTSREQYAASRKVPGGIRNAQPGDLLFWTYGGANGIHHVALYIGNGMMIASPHSGTVVQVQRVYGNPLVGRY